MSFTHIKAKVWPGAGKEQLNTLGEGKYEVFVRQPAQAGAANRRVAQLLAETLSLPVHRLRLISGFQRPNKIFEVIPQKEV